MWCDLVHGSLEDTHGGPEELVHRRPDDQDHDVRTADDARVCAQLQPPTREHPHQEGVRTVLEERHLPAADPVERVLRDVEHTDPQPGVREREAQRQPDVTGAAQDDNIERGRVDELGRVWEPPGRRGFVHAWPPGRDDSRAVFACTAARTYWANRPIMGLVGC